MLHQYSGENKKWRLIFHILCEKIKHRAIMDRN